MLQGYGVTDAVFKVKLASGKYRCTVPMGGYWRNRVSEMAHWLSANGTDVVRELMKRDEAAATGLRFDRFCFSFFPAC